MKTIPQINILKELIRKQIIFSAIVEGVSAILSMFS
jgi:hypothetical protein